MVSNLKQNICKTVVIVFFISFIYYAIQKYKTYQQKTIQHVNKARENFKDKVYTIDTGTINFPVYTLSLTKTPNLTVLTNKGTSTDIIEQFEDAPTTTQPRITRASLTSATDPNTGMDTRKIAGTEEDKDQYIINNLLGTPSELESASVSGFKKSNINIGTKTHIRFNTGDYVPIKIIPFCKLNINNDGLVFLFLLDRLSDEQYNNYNQDNELKLGTKFKNLPLLSSDGEKVYTYEIMQYNNDLLSLNTSQQFTLPFLTDSTLILKHNLDKNMSLLKNYKKIEWDKNGATTSYTSITIPNFKGERVTDMFNLDTLGVSLFGINKSYETIITPTSLPNRTYTELYLDTTLTAIEKVNGYVIKVTLTNNKWINIIDSDTDTRDIKIRFIMVLSQNSTFVNNSDDFPQIIEDDNMADTGFILNQGSYDTYFYLADSEYKSIPTDHNINIVAALYNDKIGKLVYYENVIVDLKIQPDNSVESNSDKYYIRHTVGFTSENNIGFTPQDTTTTTTAANAANAEAAEAAKATASAAERKANAQAATEAKNSAAAESAATDEVAEADAGESETLSGNFKDIVDNENDIYAKKLNESFKQTKLNDYFTDVINYSVCKVFKRDNLTEKENKYKKTSELIGKCNRGEFLSEFRKIKLLKTKKVERFTSTILNKQYWSDIYESDTATKNVIKKEIFLNTYNSTHSFNSGLGDYMYQNNNPQYNCVRVAQTSNDKQKPLGFIPLEPLDKESLVIADIISDTKILSNNDVFKGIYPYDNGSDVKLSITGIKHSTYAEPTSPTTTSTSPTILCSNNLLFKAISSDKESDYSKDKGNQGVYNRLMAPCSNKRSILPISTIPNNFEVNIDNHSTSVSRGQDDSGFVCAIGWFFAGLAIALLTVVTAGVGAIIYGVGAAALATVIIASNAALVIAAVAAIAGIAYAAVASDSNTNDADKAAINRKIQRTAKELENEMNYKTDKFNFIYNNLKLKKKTHLTPENLLNLRLYDYRMAPIDKKPIIPEHPLWKSNIDFEKGNVDSCDTRSDIDTYRRFLNNNENYAGFQPKSYYYGNDSPIGKFNGTDIFNGGSPNDKSMEYFTYDSSYYDLDDGGISLNDFGGLNYHEIYSTKIEVDTDSGKRDWYGIMNFKDVKHIPGRTDGDNDPRLEDSNPKTNHIGAYHQFVPENKALYQEIPELTYSFKRHSVSSDLINKQLLQIGVTQLLLTDEGFTDTITTVKDNLDMTPIYNLDKYIKKDTFKNIPPTSSSPTSTSSTLTPPPPTSAVTAPFINTSSQPNQSTRFPVKETFYMSEQPIYNNLIYKPQHMYDTSQNRNHFQDSGDTGCGDRLCILDANNKFAVDIVNKVVEQGTHLSFKEDYYYVTIKVTYIGKTFKTKGNFFYMTCELFEYPKQIYYEKDKIKHKHDPITDSYFFNKDNSITISNSRIGMGAFDFETYTDYLRNGDTFDFKIRIDKNIKEAQRFNMDTHDCNVGGDYEFNENCRINLNDMYYAVIYFKNYDEIISDGTFGKVQSFSYKAYPEGIPNHQNEHVFLNTERIKEKLAVSYSGNKRYIALQFVNGITFKLDNSFKNLRTKQEVSIVTPNYGIAGNQEQGDEDQFYCPDGGTLKSFKAYHDKNSIVGVEGICKDGSYTGCAGTCEDTLNPDVIPINNKKIIFGHRAFNKNGISYSDVYHKNEDSSVIGSPYSNKNSDDIAMSNYIHEISEYGGTNKMAGTERELYYINNRELLTCQDNDDQKIIGFQGNVVSKSDDTDNNTRISALGFMCDKIPIGVDTPTITKPLIANVVLPGYNTYHMRDQNKNYIGVKKDGHYSLLIVKQKPHYNDHRFKFIIRYKSSSNNIYHIISAKFLVEEGTNVILTTSQLDDSSAIDTFKKNSFGIDASNEYSINSLFDENDRNDPQYYRTYHLNSTFQLDLDDSYCAIIERQLQCNQIKKNLNHKFTLEKTTEVPQPIATKQPKPTRPSKPPTYKEGKSKYPTMTSSGGGGGGGDRIDDAQGRFYGS